MGALRSSPPPDALCQLRPKTLPLRAGDGTGPRHNRKLSGARVDARADEHPIVSRALAPISNSQIAKALIGAADTKLSNVDDKSGAKVRAGSVPITPGELMLLFPLKVSGGSFVGLFRERLLRELAAIHPRDQADVRSMLAMLDQLEALLSALA